MADSHLRHRKPRSRSVIFNADGQALNAEGSSGGGGGSSSSSGNSKRAKGHRRAKSESDGFNAVAEVERLRWAATGIADILPAEPPSFSAHAIPMLEMPAHALRDSMLHSGSGFNNYRGLYNLALIALVRRLGGEGEGGEGKAAC